MAQPIAAQYYVKLQHALQIVAATRPDLTARADNSPRIPATDGTTFYERGTAQHRCLNETLNKRTMMQPGPCDMSIDASMASITGTDLLLTSHFLEIS